MREYFKYNQAVYGFSTNPISQVDRRPLLHVNPFKKSLAI